MSYNLIMDTHDFKLDARIRTALMSLQSIPGEAAWHGCPSALGLLRGLDAHAAVWRPYPGGNNIREITLHIAFYENSVAGRLAGQQIPLGFKQRKSGWPLMLDGVDEVQWKAEIGLLKQAHLRLVDALIAFDPARLDEPVGRASDRPAAQLIHGVAEHTLYHAAQIEMLKTLYTRLAR
jgi:hypothetical protein